MKRPVCDKALRPPLVERTTGPQTDRSPQCWRCGYVLAVEVTRPWSIRCRSCHAITGNASA